MRLQRPCSAQDEEGATRPKTLLLLCFCPRWHLLHVHVHNGAWMHAACETATLQYSYDSLDTYLCPISTTTLALSSAHATYSTLSIPVSLSLPRHIFLPADVLQTDERGQLLSAGLHVGLWTHGIEPSASFPQTGVCANV
jgi:hypothetical protein